MSTSPVTTSNKFRVSHASQGPFGSFQHKTANFRPDLDLQDQEKAVALDRKIRRDAWQASCKARTSQDHAQNNSQFVLRMMAAEALTFREKKIMQQLSHPRDILTRQRTLNATRMYFQSLVLDVDAMFKVAGSDTKVFLRCKKQFEQLHLWQTTGSQLIFSLSNSFIL